MPVGGSLVILMDASKILKIIKLNSSIMISNTLLKNGSVEIF